MAIDFVFDVIENLYILMLCLSLLTSLSFALTDVLVPELHYLKLHSIKPREGNEVKRNRSSLNSLLGKSSPVKGKMFFSVCENCHNVNKTSYHKVGPNLWNVVFNKIASSDFRYSVSMLNLSKLRWSLRALNGFLKCPTKYVPGTYMTFSGLNDPFERISVIRYLMSQGDNLVEMKNIKLKV